MSTYNPPSFPRRPKTPSLVGDLRYQAQLAYYRYEINTGLYVMSPGEKLAFNLVHLFLLALMLSALYYCLPGVLTRPLRRLPYFLNGSLSSRGVQKVNVHEAVLHTRGAGEAIASLTEGGMGRNASMGVPAMF